MTVYAAMLKLIRIGNLMSNVCYNGSQSHSTMNELRKQWDSAKSDHFRAIQSRAQDLRDRRANRGAKPRLSRRRIAVE